MPDIPPISRRRALQSAAAALAAGAIAGPGTARGEDARPVSRPTVCLFSKPLHNRPFADLPALLPELGCDAVDLTCRPKGHVLPERVAEDLPRACELLAAGGVSVPMITTGITDAGQGHAEAIIRTAAGLGIRYAKLGYYRYGDLRKLHETLADVKARLRDVTAMCQHYAVQAGFHNHAGNTVGAALWDEWQLIRDLPPRGVGSYFDVRHATVEGGENGWRIGMSLLSPRIIMVAVKDFVWRKDPKRGWRVDNVPLGAGMVRLEEALRRLAEPGFAGPISLHMEYMADGQHTPAVGSPQDETNLAAIRKDVACLRERMAQVGWR